MGLSWGGGNVWDVQMQWFEGWVGAAGLGDACPCLGGVGDGVVHPVAEVWGQDAVFWGGVGADDTCGAPTVDKPGVGGLGNHGCSLLTGSSTHGGQAQVYAGPTGMQRRQGWGLPRQVGGWGWGWG